MAEEFQLNLHVDSSCSVHLPHHRHRSAQHIQCASIASVCIHAYVSVIAACILQVYCSSQEKQSYKNNPVRRFYSLCFFLSQFFFTSFTSSVLTEKNNCTFKTGSQHNVFVGIWTHWLIYYKISPSEHRSRTQVILVPGPSD